METNKEQRICKILYGLKDNNKKISIQKGTGTGFDKEPVNYGTILRFRTLPSYREQSFIFKIDIVLEIKNSGTFNTSTLLVQDVEKIDSNEIVLIDYELDNSKRTNKIFINW